MFLCIHLRVPNHVFVCTYQDYVVYNNQIYSIHIQYTIYTTYIYIYVVYMHIYSFESAQLWFCSCISRLCWSYWLDCMALTKYVHYTVR